MTAKQPRRLILSTSTNKHTRSQIDYLVSKYGYTIREIIALAIDLFYRTLEPQQITELEPGFPNNDAIISNRDTTKSK